MLVGTWAVSSFSLIVRPATSSVLVWFVTVPVSSTIQAVIIGYVMVVILLSIIILAIRWYVISVAFFVIV